VKRRFDAAEARLPDELARKNRENYDDAAGPVWQLIYESVHEGREFINLGGRRVLDEIAQRARFGQTTRVLDLCAGQAAPACYLAETYAARVTAVEINPRQAQRARANVTRRSSSIQQRVQVVEADATRWRSGIRYDSVVSLDSLMLIAAIDGLLATAAVHLEPGGTFWATTLCARAPLGDDLRRFAWDLDGMARLVTLDEEKRAMREAGFVDVDAEDRTAMAVDVSERIDAALVRHRAVIVESVGDQEYDGWIEASRRYLDALNSGQLVYALLRARRDSRRDI